MTISHTPLSMESIQFKQQYLDMLNSTPDERVISDERKTPPLSFACLAMLGQDGDVSDPFPKRA